MKVVAAMCFGVLGLTAAAAQGAELSQVHSVYLLPMSNGLDQYLANRLTNLGVFQVVADARKADAVFTDRLGEAFETRLDRLYPAPVDQAEAKAGKSADTQEAQEKKDTNEEEEDEATVKRPDERPVVQFATFSRAKGTLFLVDAKSRSVLWSVYVRPKDSSSEEMDRTAQRIADRILRTLKPKK